MRSRLRGRPRIPRSPTRQWRSETRDGFLVCGSAAIRAASSRLRLPATYAAATSPMPSPTTAARDDSPRFPECRQGDLEGELDRSIHRRRHRSERTTCRPSARPLATSRGGDSGWRRTARSRPGRRARARTGRGRRPARGRPDRRIRRPVRGRRPESLRPCDAAQVRLAAQEGVEGLDDLVPAGDDERQPVVVMPAPCAGGVGQVAEVQVAGADRPRQSRNERARSQSAAGDFAESGTTTSSGSRPFSPPARDFARGGSLLQDQVRVRPSEPERADARERRPAVLGPGFEVALDPEREGIEGDVGVRLRKSAGSGESPGGEAPAPS